MSNKRNVTHGYGDNDDYERRQTTVDVQILNSIIYSRHKNIVENVNKIWKFVVISIHECVQTLTFDQLHEMPYLT